MENKPNPTTDGRNVKNDNQSEEPDVTNEDENNQEDFINQKDVIDEAYQETPQNRIEER